MGLIAQPKTVFAAMEAAERERIAWFALLEQTYFNPYKLAEKKATYERWHERQNAKRIRCLEVSA